MNILLHTPRLLSWIASARRLLSSPYVATIMLAAGLLALNADYFAAYLSLPVPAGFDSPGHAAIGRYYADHIFPSVSGWSEKWLFGLPFPQLYPPLFFMLAAIPYLALPISYAASYKGIVLALTLALPGLLAIIGRRISGRTASGWIAGITGVFFLSTFGPFGNIGVNLYSTFNSGMVSHLLAFFLYAAWLGIALKGIGTEPKRSFRIAAVALFSLTLLANAHIVPAAAATFLIVAAGGISAAPASARRAFLARYAIDGALSVLLVAFWYLPMLELLPYMPSRALGPESGIGAPGAGFFLREWQWGTLATIFALTAGIFLRDRRVLVVAGAASAAIAAVVIPLEGALEGLPIHTYRLLPVFYLLSAPLIGYAFAVISRTAKTRLLSLPLFLAFLLPAAYSWSSYSYQEDGRGFYSRGEIERTEEILEYMRGSRDLIAIETYESHRELGYLLSDREPGIRIAYFPLVESSASSPFAIAAVNGLSARQERMPVPSGIANEKDFLEEPAAAHVARARNLGISKIFASSPRMTAALKETPGVALEKDFGIWELYQIEDPEPFASALPFEPIALFSDLSFKSGADAPFGYLSFQEEAFRRNDPRVTLARPTEQRLDRAGVFGQFRSAIIAAYRYDDIDIAARAVEEYARRQDVTLMPSTDPLFSRLAALDLPLLHVATTTSDSPGAKRISVRAVLEEVSARAVPTAKNAQKLLDASYEGGRIHVRGIESDERVPVLIRATYSPGWDDETGTEAIFMATPTFMLIFAREDITLEYETSRTAKTGLIVSLTGLLLLAALAKKRSSEGTGS